MIYRNAAREGPSQHAQKFGKILPCGFRVMRADKQTDKRTYLSQYFAPLPWDEVMTNILLFIIKVTATSYSVCYLATARSFDLSFFDTVRVTSRIIIMVPVRPIATAVACSVVVCVFVCRIQP